MNARTTTRAATTLALLAVYSGALAGPALAASPVDAGAEPGQPLTMLETLLLFVGAPLGLFVVISLLALAPSIVRSGRESSLGWWSEPVWFGGPRSDAESGKAASSARAALPSADQAEEPAEPSGPATARGGASARW